MAQLLLLPDPRPLVDRLGADFFRQAPLSAGVYLMRDESDTVLYVGKAKSLRKRLASYRVANPDRLPRRHLRLLRAVARIELQTCADEAAALAREAELLRTLRPRFNRAGTWPGPERYLACRLTDEGLDLAVTTAAIKDRSCCGPMGAGAIHIRAVLVRLLWCALRPDRGLVGMPQGWFRGCNSEVISIPRLQTQTAKFQQAAASLDAVFAGQADQFIGWIRACTETQSRPFELTVRETDLEAVTDFASRLTRNLG